MGRQLQRIQAAPIFLAECVGTFSELFNLIMTRFPFTFRWVLSGSFVLLQKIVGTLGWQTRQCSQ